MRPFSFIHCADIHLGCRPFDLAERGADFKRAFEDIIDTAIARRVDFVIIAGDLFHQRAISADTLSDAVDALSALKSAGIRCYCIEGNHDRAATLNTATFVDFLDRQSLAKLLRPVFDAQGGISLDGAVVTDDHCRIIGLGYLGATAPLRLKQAAALLPEADRFTLCALHAGHKGLADTDMSYVPTEGFEPLRGKAHYVALGHAHQMRAHDHWLFTPGAPEHVHIDEASPGRKGFFHVRVAQDGRFEAEHIPSSPRPTRLLSLDVTGARDAQHLDGMITACLDGAGDLTGAVARLRLYGEAAFDADALDAAALAGDMRARRGCLYALVEPMYGRARSARTAGVQSLDMFEHDVLKEMLLNAMPEAAGMEDTLADAMYMYKEGRADAAVLLAAVQHMVERTHAH